jgi:hypothetical protein
MAIIIYGKADGASRKAGKVMGHAMLNLMHSHKTKGDCIRVTEAIPAGDYVFTHTENADGMIELDLTPGKVT